jgi:hypothetical protein
MGGFRSPVSQQNWPEIYFGATSSHKNNFHLLILLGGWTKFDPIKNKVLVGWSLLLRRQLLDNWVSQEFARGLLPHFAADRAQPKPFSFCVAPSVLAGNDASAREVSKSRHHKINSALLVAAQKLKHDPR